MKKLLMACCVIMALAYATTVLAQDPNYTVKPGDMLSISVWKEPDLQKQTLVRPDGSFSFPLVGEVDAKGKTVADLNKTLSQRLTQVHLRSGGDRVHPGDQGQQDLRDRPGQQAGRIHHESRAST